MKLILLVALIVGCTSNSHNIQSNAGISSDGSYGYRYDSQQRQYRADDDGLDSSAVANVGFQDQSAKVKNSQVLQVSPIQQSSASDVDQTQQYARDEEQKSQIDDEVSRDDSAQSPQLPINRSPSMLPSSVPEVKVKQQIEEEVQKRKVDSLISSGVGGSAHQQIIRQNVPVSAREQSVSSVHVSPQRVQLVQQALPFVSYSNLGYSSLIPQREIYVPSYSSYVPNAQQQQVYQLLQASPVQQSYGGGVEQDQYYVRNGLLVNVEQKKSQIDDEVSRADVLQASAQIPQLPINRSPLSPSFVPELKVKQQSDVLSERDDIFPQVLTGQRRLTEPVEDVPKKRVSVQSVESLISSGAGIGGVSHQQIIPQSVPVVRDQSVSSVQVPQRVQLVQQQALPFVSYSQLGNVQQKEVQLPSISSLVNVPNVQQQQIVNQVVREVKQQVQPIFHNLRSQPLSPHLSGQRQYIQTLLQPSTHHLVFQPQSLQISSLRQLVNPYQGQYVLPTRQWQQPLFGGSQLIVQPLQYSGAQDASVRRLDGFSGYEMSAKPDDNLKLIVDQQSEPHPGLYGHQFGTKSVA